MRSLSLCARSCACALLMCVTDITEVVIVLNSDEAVKAFSRGGNVTVGGASRRGRGEVGAR